MPGIHRPTRSMAPEKVARGEEMRRGGVGYREIAAEIGVSLMTAYNKFRYVLITGGGAAAVLAATIADDRELAGELDAAVRECAECLRGMASNLGGYIAAEADALAKAKAEGKRPPRRIVMSKDAATLTKAIVELRKLAQLTRGQVTARTEVINRTEPEPTPEEKEEMDRINRLAAAAAEQGLIQ